MIRRTSFGYLEPRGRVPGETFAQCGTCRDWTGTGCRILDPKLPVPADASCNLYVPGEPAYKDRGKEKALLSRAEVGYVVRQVRCGNCAWFDAENSRCNGFAYMNYVLTWFQKPISEHVQANACCNLQTPR